MSTDGKTEATSPRSVSPTSVSVTAADPALTGGPRAVEGGTVDLPPEEVQHALNQSQFDMPAFAGVQPPLRPAGYEMAGKLGEGTYGEVWRGRHARTGVQVAIKFLRARPGASLHSLAEEARKLALLHGDPRIVQLMDVEERTAPPYFVMDFAEHGSLAARLEQGPLPLAEALPLFRQIVEAMAYVHAKGIRHCDLKPGNILLDAADRPRVADFGQSHLSVEATHAALGTFFYMAPEQALTERRSADPRWDVFGLGALLYAMLTGTPPRFDPKFKAELEATAQLSHRLERYRKWVETAPPPAGHRAVKGMDRLLAEIIDRCLAADPARRYCDAGQLLRALDRRERRRRNRPLVVFGMVAPLLFVMSLAGLAFHSANTTGRAVQKVEAVFDAHTRHVDLTTAQLLADIVGDKLQDMKHKAATLAHNDNLRKAFGNYLAGVERHDLAAKAEALGELQGWLGRVGKYEDQLRVIAVLDAGGTLHAAWVRTSVHGEEGRPAEETYGRNYVFRDYWTHRGEDYRTPAILGASAAGLLAAPLGDGSLRLASAIAAAGTDEGHDLPGRSCHLAIDRDGKGNAVPYIGQPAVSTAFEHFNAISVSAPIFRKEDRNGVKRRELIGLLLGWVELDRFNDWLKSVRTREGEAPGDADACVVVLDRRGYCVHHRDRSAYQPPPFANPEAQSSPVYDAVRAGAKGVAEHVDPYDQKRYTAAYVPIPDFGWSVIFQYDPKNELVLAKDEVQKQVHGLRRVAVGLGVTLLVAFWGWLLWTLYRREATAHA